MSGVADLTARAADWAKRDAALTVLANDPDVNLTWLDDARAESDEEGAGIARELATFAHPSLRS